MPSVFISHSTSDRAFVEGVLVPLLEVDGGFALWYSPHDIPSASEWERKIKQGLEASDWFVVVLSPDSVGSEWVRDEVCWAIENRPGKIVPVLVADCDATGLHLRLGRLQHVDFRDPLGQPAREQLLATLSGTGVEATAPHAGHQKRVGQRRVVISAGLGGCSMALLAVMLAFPLLFPELQTARSAADRSACGSRLRGLHAAAYGDAARAGTDLFPHVRAEDERDGPADVVRAFEPLVRSGALEPRALVCPASQDVPAPLGAEREGFAFADPDVRTSRELSYGWTARRLGLDDEAPLAADRSAGEPRGHVVNHQDGRWLLRTDGSIEWLGEAPTPEARAALAELNLADSPR